MEIINRKSTLRTKAAKKVDDNYCALKALLFLPFSEESTTYMTTIGSSLPSGIFGTFWGEKKNNEYKDDVM